MNTNNNLHPYERFFRIFIGIILVSMAFFGPENLWFLVGLIPLLTGLYGWCFFYQFFGVSSCPLIDNENQTPI